MKPLPALPRFLMPFLLASAGGYILAELVAPFAPQLSLPIFVFFVLVGFYNGAQANDWV